MTSVRICPRCSHVFESTADPKPLSAPTPRRVSPELIEGLIESRKRLKAGNDLLAARMGVTP